MAGAGSEAKAFGSVFVMRSAKHNKQRRRNKLKIYHITTYAVVFIALFTTGFAIAETNAPATVESSIFKTRYHTIKVDDLEIFYREAGSRSAPTIVLLHGFPTSSHMFRNLIPALADDFHLVAPDYPGFGNSSMPDVSAFEYTFDNLADVMGAFLEALNLDRYSLYVMDYGAPIGFRLAVRHPERIEALIIQNGNAYEEGLREFWDPIRKYWKHRTPENAQPLAHFISPEGVKWQYTHGVRDKAAISPDNWNVDLRHLTKEGNPAIQLALFYDYQNNIPHYSAWQTYFRKYQPPALIVWGKNDFIFPAEGAYPYRQDLKNLEFHLLETGHFALEEDGNQIADLMRRFLKARHASK